MCRCFQLAANALGNVAPNPMVGSVIVKDGKVIGEGFHQQFGKNHAEVNAIESVKNKEDLKGAALYVNLEPCTHFGKTPPCADKIIESGISEVYIAGSDPSEKVKGNGIEKLRLAGVKVESNILFNEEEKLNRRFRTFHLKKRPYIILKWAQSKDGFMDKVRKEGDKGQFQISNKATKRLLHKWRSEEQAILIGANTALNDDPSLTTRLVEGKNPLRLVLDLNNRLPNTLKLFQDGEKTIIYSNQTLEENSVSKIDVSQAVDLLETIAKDLYKRDIQSVIVEGGKMTLESFIKADLWDEVRVFQSNESLNEGLKAPEFKMKPSSEMTLGDNTYFNYLRRK